jgi:hypothetical protein
VCYREVDGWIAWIHILCLDHLQENEGESSVVRFSGIEFWISGSW